SINAAAYGNFSFIPITGYVLELPLKTARTSAPTRSTPDLGANAHLRLSVQKRSYPSPDNGYRSNHIPNPRDKQPPVDLVQINPCKSILAHQVSPNLDSASSLDNHPKQKLLHPSIQSKILTHSQDPLWKIPPKSVLNI